jgi:D-alanyl-D-alanine carboxypeptidase
MDFGRCAWRIGVVVVVGALFGAALASVSSGASAASCSGGRAATRPLPLRTLARVRQAVRRFKDINHTPGVLIGIWSPRGRFVSATGVADLKTGRRLTTNMQFKIASQTKAFTNDLILQLVGAGQGPSRRPHLQVD